MNKHIYVIMRMSVISKTLKSTWISGRNTFEDYVKAILDNNRLDQHFTLFENIALPSLINQEDFNVESNLTLIILTTDRLEQKYINKLNSYCEKYSWIRVSYLDDECTVSDYNNLLTSEIKKKTLDTKVGTLFATVRLDDDDALSSIYCSKLFKFMKSEFIGFGYSAPNGAVGFLKNNNFEDFHKYQAKNIALGLGLINYYAYSTQTFNSKYTSIYSLGDHTLVDQHVPVITDGSYLAYLRTRHIDSDSDSDYMTSLEKKKPKLDSEVIRQSFKILESYYGNLSSM